MPADGGPAQRMTWLGCELPERCADWTPDGRIVFVTTHGQPFFRYFRAYALAPAGGHARTAATRAGEPSFVRSRPGKGDWPQHRGPRALEALPRWHRWPSVDRHFRVRRNFRRMTELKGNVTSPMWVGDRVYFLSDMEGVGNLYSCRPDGADLKPAHRSRRLLRALCVRPMAGTSSTSAAPEIWLFDPAAERNAGAWTSGCPAHRTQAARRFVTAADQLDGSPDASGRPQPGGRHARQVLHLRAVGGRGAAARKRRRSHDCVWVSGWPTAGRCVAVSDATGEERVVVFDEAGERTLDWDIGRVLALRAAPAGTRIALTNHRNEVWIGDVASGETWLVDRSDAGRSDDVAWSPDGLWLAYSFWVGLRHCAIKLHDTAARTSVLVTRPEFRDWSPAFDPEGKYLYFLSVRTFDPVYDNVQFELSFPRAARPYLIALQADARPPFEPEPKSMRAEHVEAGEAAKAADARKEERKLVRIDVDGIEARVAQLSGSGGTLRADRRCARQGAVDGVPDSRCARPGRTP